MPKDNYLFIESKLKEALREGKLDEAQLISILQGFRSDHDRIDFILMLLETTPELVYSNPSFRDHLFQTGFSSNYRARELAGLDLLTGIMNRQRFMELLNDELATAKRYREELSVLLLDIDHFKQINDVYGHQTGDEVLKDVAQTIDTILRPQDKVGRYGGEEYIVSLPRTSKDKASGVIADRIKRSVGLTKIGNSNQKLTVTGGIATFPNDGQDIDSLVLRADSSLYYGKEHGRNQIVPYSPDIPLKKS